MNNRQEINELITNIKKQVPFNNYISDIIFPTFKNYTENSSIKFNFPLTLLVGKNGIGKSSTLHALWGCVKGKTISPFWFSTSLDPIEEYQSSTSGESERHCYFYRYGLDGDTYEVLYRRAKKDGRGYEYWETGKPTKKYGMDTTLKRSTPIVKNVIFLDFRKELSAFDKFMYFGDTSHLVADNNQDLIRQQSPKVDRAIKTQQIYHNTISEPLNKTPIELSNHELHEISNILQENYSKGVILSHKLFRLEGESAILTKWDFTYSEAHAGSGEFAVVQLVHSVLTAKPGSLILLDEPETSLHPGAQKKLLLFLLKQIEKYHHQIVLATHSPFLAEDLPKESIKRFYRNDATHKVDIYNACFPSEAFNFLGSGLVDNPRLCKIHVEDILAQKIINRILQDNYEEMTGFQIFSTPGGADDIKCSYITHYSQDLDNKKFVIFDGDQKSATRIIPVADLPRSSINKEALDNIIFNITNSHIKFIIDGGNGSRRDDQFINKQLEYIEYYRTNVEYLPAPTPEELIWNNEVIIKYLSSYENIIDIPATLDKLRKVSEFKQKIHILVDEVSQKTCTSIRNIQDSVENFLISNWLLADTENKIKIRNILQNFMEKIN